MTQKINPLFEQSRRLRRDQTPAERALWEELRNRKLGNYKFRRQHNIANFIVDFYCAEKKLNIEVDGGIHAKQRDDDLTRTERLVSLGYKVLRFTNWDVEREMELVKGKILTACLEGHF